MSTLVKKTRRKLRIKSKFGVRGIHPSMAIALRVAKKMSIKFMNFAHTKTYEKGTHKRTMLFDRGIVDIPTTIDGVKRQYHVAWNSFFSRAYSERIHKINPSYRGCSVDTAWWVLSCFAKWHKKNYVKGWHLDKDILIPGNKIYGPRYCCYVPAALNLLFEVRPDTEVPVGLSYCAKLDKYEVKTKIHGRTIHLGRYAKSAIGEAKAAYRKVHAAHIIDVANRYKDQLRSDVYETIIWRAENGIF